MECKLCEKEQPVNHFHNHKLKVCNDCIEFMGYDHQKMGERIYHQYKKNLDKSVKEEVQRTLSSVIEKLMVESGLEFELKVI
jgi:hypothetical protein